MAPGAADALRLTRRRLFVGGPGGSLGIRPFLPRKPATVASTMSLEGIFLVMLLKNEVLRDAIGVSLEIFSKALVS